MSETETRRPRDFFQAYESGSPPWDSGVVEAELVRHLDAGHLPGETVLEPGCGTGENVVELARRGYAVTSFDLVPRAVELASEKARAAGVTANIRVFDLANDDPASLGGPFDVLFDRGVYHCVREGNLAAYQRLLEVVSRPGTRYLSLSGNAKEQNEGEGPPRITLEQIREELGGLFDILEVAEVRLQTKGIAPPLFWSVLMERR